MREHRDINLTPQKKETAWCQYQIVILQSYSQKIN